MTGKASAPSSMTRFRRALYSGHPPWKQKLIVHTFLLWLLLIVHAAFLGWSRRDDSNLSAFWGAFGFDVLGVATDCAILRDQQSAWSLAVNILATLITYVSSDIMLALSAPSRSQLDASHAAGKYMEVGVHSFHNIVSPNFGWKRRILWVLLIMLILPFHLMQVQVVRRPLQQLTLHRYNSVIIVSQPASESYQISVPDSAFSYTPDRAAVSQSILDPAATEPPLPVSIAATAPVSGAVIVAPSAVSIPSGSAATTASSDNGPIVTEPSSSPTSCGGPTGTDLTIQTDPPDAKMQPRLDQDCDEFTVAPCGMGCEDLASRAGVSFFDFRQWNPDVTVGDDDNCKDFYGGYTYCVGVSSQNSRRRSNAPLAVRAGNSSAGELELADSTERLEPWLNFHNWRSAYATAPYLAWTANESIDARNPSEWPGLSSVTADLEDLLSLGYRTDLSQPLWDSLNIDSSDWVKLSLEDCRESFNELYRPSTGTVVLVVSGLKTKETVVGLSYLSYNWTDLVVSCPTDFLQSTASGSDLIEMENPPVLPLIFGTFGEREAYGPGHPSLEWDSDDSLCPKSYSLLGDYAPGSQPKVEGCLLKSRPSECRIGVNILFTVILFIALALKALCMTAALFVLEEEPILTVGDAVAAYLEKPDPSLEGCSLSWTKQRGWEVLNGAIMTYQHGGGQPSGDESSEARWKDGALLWLATWPGRQWRKVWGYRDMGRDQAVPRTDVFNNLHTMRSSDSAVWLWFYMITLWVCFGIFYSINSQDGWIVLPAASNDLYWMLWPTVLCNLPQLFATIRGFVDTWILSSRSALEDFASYAAVRKGLRVSAPQKDSAQYPAYFFGGINAIVFVVATGLQTLYAWIISEYAQPQWINPLRPSDQADYFSPAFLMKIGADTNRSLAGKVCFGVLIGLFPFLAVHLVNMTQSLVVRVRALSISELSTFIPRYLADVLLLRWVTPFGRPEKTARLLPQVPLQMPGPATSSLIIALACQPAPGEEPEPGASLGRVRWGVLRRPLRQQQGPAEMADDEKPRGVSLPASFVAPAAAPPPAPHALFRAAPARSSISRKPLPPRRALSDDSAVFPTMRGAPHLSGDEAALAHLWLEDGEPRLVPPYARGAGPADEEKGLAKGGLLATERALAPASSTDSGAADWLPGHCGFSVHQVDEPEPSKPYTGIRRGEGDLSLFEQVIQLCRRAAHRARGKSGESVSQDENGEL